MYLSWTNKDIVLRSVCVLRHCVSGKWQVLLYVLVAHLVNLESEINEGTDRYNRNATVIWHAKGPFSLVHRTECNARRQNSQVLLARGRAGLFALFRLCDAYREFWDFSFYIICFAPFFVSFFIRCTTKP